HRLAPRQEALRRGGGGLAPVARDLPAAPARGRGLAPRHPDRGAPLGLSPLRRGPSNLGAQHPRASCLALRADLPDPGPDAAARAGSSGMKLTIRPLTPDLWPAVEDLFGEKGACNGCWCMYGRIGSGYWKRPRERNRADFREIVKRGPPPGLLAFA